MGENLWVFSGETHKKKLGVSSKSDFVNINDLDSISTDYFILASCYVGAKDLDQKTRGSSNFALDLLLGGKHTINKSVIAPDKKLLLHWSTPDQFKGDGNGIRSFSLTYPSYGIYKRGSIGKYHSSISEIFHVSPTKEKKGRFEIEEFK